MMKLMPESVYHMLVVLLAAMLYSATVMADSRSVSPPADPRQSINYWKAHSIPADKDPLVLKSQSIFSVLLRGWDSARLEPGLYVVESASGAWAASLADGNILLSRAAIDTCMSFGEQRGENLLAFVLAHELAHQRSDDLWHQRFFRMIGDHSPESRQKMMQGLQLDDIQLSDIEQKEAQADHDGLILMASVGYDPYQILDENSVHSASSKPISGNPDFFTSWVENIWQERCGTEQNAALKDACAQAQARALRTRAQLTSVATQALVYEMGVQAFVAKNYAQAREYFTAYGRDYPSRAVLSAIGLSYLAEAEENQAQLIQLGALQQPDFYYPLMLDTHADAQALNTGTQTQKRSDSEALIKRLQQQKHATLEQAVQLFEKAIKLEPMHRKTYLLLATAYLLDNNPYMVRGVLQGSYQPKLGADPAVDMMLALTSAIEHKTENKTGTKSRNNTGNQDSDAEKSLDTLIAEINSFDGTSAMPHNLLVYSMYYNRAALAIFKGDDAKAAALWKQLAAQSKTSGNALLFRLALDHVLQHGANTQSTQALITAPTIHGKRIGDRIDKAIQPLNDLWIDGEQYHVYRANDGGRYITSASGEIISAWQNTGNDSLSGLLTVGDSADRPFKTLGTPDRRIDMQSGEYLAYDRYGLALHVNADRITGWFLYDH